MSQVELEPVRRKFQQHEKDTGSCDVQVAVLTKKIEHLTEHLKANPHKKAVGTVIESSLDKGRGYLATLLVQGGTLHTGDIMLSGMYTGKVKAMFNERGQKITEAGPSVPVSVLGLNGAPQAGDTFNIDDYLTLDNPYNVSPIEYYWGFSSMADISPLDNAAQPSYYTLMSNKSHTVTQQDENEQFIFIWAVYRGSQLYTSASAFACLENLSTY